MAGHSGTLVAYYHAFPASLPQGRGEGEITSKRNPGMAKRARRAGQGPDKMLEELREVRHTVTRERGGLLRPWPEFALPTATVWGATAIFLDQLLKMFSEEESRQLALDVSPRFQA